MDADMLGTDLSNYCLSIKHTSTPSGEKFGLVIVDTSTCTFTLLSFTDDPLFSKLETVLQQYTPKEIVYERSLSQDVLKCIKTSLQNTLPQFSPQGTYSSNGVWELLNGYIKDTEIPFALEEMKEDEACMLSLSGLLTYLKNVHF